MKTSNVVVAAVAAVACTALLAVVALVALAPSDADLGFLVGAMFTGVGSMIAALVSLARVSEVKATVDDLANGKMDAKIRAGVADVLPDHAIDPAVRDQLAQDRAVRDHAAG